MCVAGTSLLLLGLALLILPHEMSGAKTGRKRAEAGGRTLSRGAGLDEVILRGPGSGCMGTLEALHQGEWRTVQVNSDRSSSKMIAHVACRHVGCGSLVHFSYHPMEPVAQPSWEVKVSCRGSEATLEQCRYTEPVRTRETSGSRLDITCAESVRLVRQYSDCVGFLAVRAGGGWADVCSSALLLADKRVMCRELGCGAPVTYRTQLPDQRIKKFFGCRGNESRLQDCSAGEWTADACESPDFLLACQNPPTPLRVVGAVGACQGLLEVRYQREWRPLQAVWERQHSQLACAALRCGAATALSRTELDPHRAAWEPNQQCMVELWGQPTPRLCTDWLNAPTSQGVQVTCSEQVPTVRLVPQGSDRCMGRVEVRVGGSWGSLCESSSNQNHWKVVCKELACGFYSNHISLPWPVTAGPVWSIEFGCHGNESSYTNCTATPPSNTCAADEPYVVALDCTERLAAPVMSLSSTSAKHHNGDRRTDVVFGGHAFVIACFAHTVYTIQTFRLQATSEWFLPAVNNSAHFLFQAADRSHQGVYKCSYSLEQAPGFFHHTASHTLHTVKERRDVRLVGGASRCEGELEVKHQSQWRPISYSSWREQEAGVACRQLGCGALVYTGRAPPPAGPRDTWRFLTDCGGAEAALTDCGVMRPQHTADAPVLVICSDILLRPNISMSSMMAGDPRVSRDPDQDKLSVFRGHSFTITCSVRPQYPGGTFNLHFAGTNRTDTHTQPAVNHTAHFLFPAAGSAHQGNYTCVYLVTFHATAFTSESAVLFITIWKHYQEVKLVWGSSPCDGRLLVNYLGEWKTLVSESAAWGLKHAAIVCRQLGCGAAVSTRRVTGPHRTRALRYFSDCRGSEVALLDCGSVTDWPSDGGVEVNCEARQRAKSEDDMEEDYSNEDL